MERLSGHYLNWDSTKASKIIICFSKDKTLDKRESVLGVRVRFRHMIIKF